MKTLKLSLVLTSIISLTILGSCESEDSADVNQDRIFTDYELFYNENTDVSRVLASFRFGTNILGTTLELNDPAGVIFDGVELPYSNLLLGHTREIAGQVNSGIFVYTNADGETFMNSIPEYNTIAFPSNLSEISASEAFSLVWTGPVLEEHEEVSVFVGSLDTEDALFFVDSEGANNIVLGKDQLERLTPGENVFYMERILRLDADQATDAGGNKRVRYRTTNKTITITE